MKARPILFNGGMVRALLGGRKTQTRRVVKPQPTELGFSYINGSLWASPCNIDGLIDVNARCPYGQSGDLLWVRESWATRLDRDHLPPRDLNPGTVGYWADGPGKCCQTGCAGAAGRVRASMHMPRWASRITLKITDIRVERVQDISEGDALAEGIAGAGICYGISPAEANVLQYKTLWNSINDNWDENPFVWVVEFEVIKKNVDQILETGRA